MYNILKRISNFLYNLRIPIVKTEYVVNLDLPFVSISEDEKWIYYWEGDLISGHNVRVSAEEQRAYLRKERK